MGKRIISQRRGKGSFTYRAHSHRWLGELSNRKYDDSEKNSAVEGKVVDLLHSSGHSAPIMKVKYSNGETILMSAPHGIRVNDSIKSGSEAEPKLGNTLPLKKIPEGTDIYNIEGLPGDGGKFARTAGSAATVVSHTGEQTIVRLPSKKEKAFSSNCRATIGIIAGGGRLEKPLCKAGKSWHMRHARGKLYPQTSGVAMNAVDHPFGSGRGRHVGKSKIAPWGAPPGRNVGLIRARRTGRKRA